MNDQSTSTPAAADLTVIWDGSTSSLDEVTEMLRGASAFGFGITISNFDAPAAEYGPGTIVETWAVTVTRETPARDDDDEDGR